MGRVIALLLAACSATAVAQLASTDVYLKLFDADGDGLISQAEYVTYMSRGFHAMDVNHDGVLDTSEMPPSPRQRGPLTEARHRRLWISTDFVGLLTEQSDGAGIASQCRGCFDQAPR